jgi:phosphoglycolate phosphatase/pyrophosphatase PpaX
VFRIKIQTVIFDFDGTLADTLPLVFYAFQRVFKEYEQRNVTPEDIIKMFGPSEVEIIQNNISDHEKIEDAIHSFYQYYMDHHRHLVKHSQEILDLLHYLKAKDMNLAIVTGKARKSLDISLQTLKMDSFFDVVITADDLNYPKPHPEGILKVLETLKADKNHTLFIGDSLADIEAGKRAGVYTIAVQWLSTPQTREFAIQPHQLFYHINEFIEFIDRLGY